MFSCDFCEKIYRKESEFNSHKEAVWCDECQAEWKCKYHIAPSRCDECDLRWNCDIKHDIHKHQKHMLECDICQSKCVKESTLKYHNQVWYCEACDSNFECEYEFIDHAERQMMISMKQKLMKNLQMESLLLMIHYLRSLCYQEDQMKRSKIVLKWLN